MRNGPAVLLSVRDTLRPVGFRVWAVNVTGGPTLDRRPRLRCPAPRGPSSSAGRMSILRSAAVQATPRGCGWVKRCAGRGGSFATPPPCEAPRRALVTAGIQVVQVRSEPAQEARLLDAEVGAGQVGVALPSVGGLDESFEHVEDDALDAVAEEELLAAGKSLQRGDEPQQEVVPGFERGAESRARRRRAARGPPRPGRSRRVDSRRTVAAGAPGPRAGSGWIAPPVLPAWYQTMNSGPYSPALTAMSAPSPQLPGGRLAWCSRARRDADVACTSSFGTRRLKRIPAFAGMTAVT